MHRVKTGQRIAWDQDATYASPYPFHRYKVKSSNQYTRPLPTGSEDILNEGAQPSADIGTNHFDGFPLPSSVALLGMGRNRRPIAEHSLRRKSYAVWSQVRYSVFQSWLNVLVLFVPAGFAVRYTSQSPVVVFAINFIAIIPLAISLGFASEELTKRTGDNLGALINSTFSNAAQFIISILLLKDRQVTLLQISLVGSILSNMHLAVGLGFLLGGMNRNEQQYNAKMAQILGTGLLLAVAALVIPTIIQQFQISQIDEAKRLSISRSIAIVLLLCYGIFLFYQLKTHLHEFLPQAVSNDSDNKEGKEEGATRKASVAGSKKEGEADAQEEEDREPTLLLSTAIVSLITHTTLLAFNTAFATDSLDGLIEKTGLTNTFIGIVLLPLLGVDFTLFPIAMRDKMDQFLLLTVGKCLQITLLVIPVIILLGWIMGVPVGLNLDPFEAIALYASIIYINNMIQAGRSTYLQGVLLLALFAIICTVSFHLSTQLQ